MMECGSLYGEVKQGKGMGMSYQGVAGLVTTVLGAVFVALPRLTDSNNKNAALGLGIGFMGPLCLAIAPRKCSRNPPRSMPHA